MSSPEPSHDRRRRRLAAAASLAFHALLAVLLGSALSSLFVRPHAETAAPQESITIAKRTPAPTPVPTPTPTPAPTAAARAATATARPAPPPPLAIVPPPPPVAPPHPSRVRPRRPELSRPARVPVAPAAPPVRVPASAPPVLAHGTRPGPKVPGRARLSDSQIASIESDLGSAIARDRANAGDVLHVEHPEPVATAKDYGGNYRGFDDVGDARRGHGLCDPIRNWVDGDYDYYYVACEVHLSDGGQRREIVPWPVRFPPRDDPFNGTARGNEPLAMPLPGWHKDASTEISAELRQYAKDNGVDL